MLSSLMGVLIVNEFMSLDGVGQSPGRPDEDPSGDFTAGGWQAQFLSPAGPDIFAAEQAMNALLLGRRTYDIFSDYWPHASPTIPFTGLLNSVPKYVASRTLNPVLGQGEPETPAALGWAGSHLLTEPVATAVPALTERYDETHVIGSLNLVQSLLQLGLVDRLQLWVYPIVLGRGKRVFENGTVPTTLELTASQTYPPGVLALIYERVGPPVYRSMD